MILRSTGSYGSCSAGSERCLFVVNPFSILELFPIPEADSAGPANRHGYRIAKRISYEIRRLKRRRVP
jgi:hypothetical protein